MTHLQHLKDVEYLIVFNLLATFPHMLNKKVKKVSLIDGIKGKLIKYL